MEKENELSKVPNTGNPKIELGAEKEFDYGNAEIELSVKNKAVAKYIKSTFHELTMLIGSCNIPIKMSMEILLDRKGSEKYL